MTVIAIDTASRTIALVMTTDAQGAVEEARELRGGALDRLLPAALAALLPASLEAVVVLTGPGSYTGVRGGMAAALGIATGRHVPLHGVNNLVAIAAAAPDGVASPFAVVTDAGRGGVYCATFESRDGTALQLTGIERRRADDLDGSLPVVSTTAIPGLDTQLVTPAAALAAAVPLALAGPALAPEGLAATHASRGPATTP